jgi:O-antigen/teichoic acid export membrane protein
MQADRQPADVPAGGAAKGGSVDSRMVKGAFWMVLARVLDRGLGFVSTIVLARLLVPEDFGVVAMATAIVAVLDILRAFGFDVALIQNPNATRGHYDTAWTCNILLGAIIALALVALAVPAAAFYDEPRLVLVILCLAAAAFITGLENIGVVAFRKELDFHKEFNLFFAKRMVTFLITIPLAIAVRNYWALVVGVLVGRVGSVVLTYMLHPYRPKLSLAEYGHLFHFGKWLVASTFLNVLGTRSGDFLIGKTAGAHALGVYTISNELANLPTSDLIAPVNRAMLPGYAQKASHLPTLARSYLDVSALLALLAVPAGTGIAALADLIVPVVLGSNWSDAVPVIAILSFFGMLIAVKSNSHYVYLALGKPRVATWVGFLQISLLLPLLTWGSIRAGATGAALGSAVAELIFTPISLSIIAKELRLKFWEVYRPLFRPFVAAALMYALVRVASGALMGADRQGPVFFTLVACMLLGVVLYCGAIFVLWSVAGRPTGPERHVLQFMHTQLWPRIRALRLSPR